MGAECVGRVLEVGDGVTDLRPGQWVMALAAGAMADRTIADARLTAPVPEHLALSSAATLPVAFLAAHAALEAARLGPGDTLLVHAAAGGTGLAVLALARARGIRVLATASAGKQAFVARRGADAVFDSRQATFAAAVREATQGRGVDAVVNSLTSPGFIEASLAALTRGGRFVELAKRDIWSGATMAAARPDVGYHVIDLHEDSRHRPATVGAALRDLREAFSAGTLTALPARLFAAQDAASPFASCGRAGTWGSSCSRGSRAISVNSSVRDRRAASSLPVGWAVWDCSSPSGSPRSGRSAWSWPVATATPARLRPCAACAPPA